MGPNGTGVRIGGVRGAGPGAGLGRGTSGWQGAEGVGFEFRLSGLGQFFAGGGERVD